MQRTCRRNTDNGMIHLFWDGADNLLNPRFTKFAVCSEIISFARWRSNDGTGFNNAFTHRFIMHGTSGTLLTVTMQLHARNSLSIRSPICHTLVVCQNCCTCDISSNFSLYRRPIVLVLSARTLLQNPDGIVSQSMWTLNAGINSKN